jgi:putative DNA primase/helicase
MTIELKTGSTRLPLPSDYCTKSTACVAAPAGTPCPMWLAFLNRVTGGNDAIIGFLKRFLGYCLTGHVHEHVLVFLYGTGANGKGVFCKTVTDIFNDYAVIAPMEMFVATNIDRHPTEIARLKGVRLVVAHETQKGRRWDEAKIKNLTGGDTLTGRFMRGDFFDFKPTHKLMIAGNHMPALRSVDEAFRRRLLRVPFTVTIPEKDRDPKLADKLKAEWPAILRWMIDGQLDWRRDGLKVPEVIRRSTDEYLADQDTLAQWASESIRPDLDPKAFLATRALFATWKTWCDDRNLAAGTEMAFTESLKDRGYERDRQKSIRGFKGLRWKKENEE